MKTFWITMAGVVLAGYGSVSMAAATDDLSHFLKTVTSAQGNFEQKVFTRDGENKEAAGSGDFAFLRPGKFKWHYNAPFEELIVTDGKTLWLYDTELAQVTQKALSGAIPASPASLLFGAQDFRQDFHVENLASDDGLQWLKATPKDDSNAFSEVRIGFKNGLPQKMSLWDNFGQETRLNFENFQTNVKFKATDFTFKVPKGVDVLKDNSAF